MYRKFLKHWRPVSLLNVSYKLISALTANRHKQAQDYIMNENQKGFPKGIFIRKKISVLFMILFMKANFWNTDTHWF